jgi:hypothetical protein
MIAGLYVTDWMGPIGVGEFLRDIAASAAFWLGRVGYACDGFGAPVDTNFGSASALDASKLKSR